MGVLGARFPEEERREYVDRHLVLGCVVYLFCEFTSQPKDKYLVLVTLEEPPILFVINSNINKFIRERKYLLDCQITVEPKHLDFLDHDSYLDCGQPIVSFSIREIKTQLMDDITRLKGKLPDSKLIEIKKVVEKARTITPIQKRAILNSL